MKNLDLWLATLNRLAVKNSSIKNFIRQIFLFVFAAGLAACTATANRSAEQGSDYFPGGEAYYSWGASQSKENFLNVERAQSAYSPYSKERAWIDLRPTSRASAEIIGLQAYYPLHVRWKLKDGREFILENIDFRPSMHEYFKTHDIKLQWQKEGRSKAKVGDAGPLLVHEIKDDTVRIKWVITTNHTPVNQRLTATGAATKWVMTDEEYLVATFQGIPTSGINFDKWFEKRN